MREEPGKLVFCDHQGNTIARIEGGQLTYVNTALLGHLGTGGHYVFELMAKQGIRWP